MYLSTWRTGVVGLLFPALLLLPALHLHPAQEHAHGTAGAHTHPPVVHADFLPFSAHEHETHKRGHDVPDNPSSWPLLQISFPTLLPRSLALWLPALEQSPLALSVEAPVLTIPFLLGRRVLARGHLPPVQDIAFPPASPRSPPHHT